MPTYDYVCQACEASFEFFQPMSESPKRKCPTCGKLKLKRLIGAGGGLIFKGSGFYLTDYRSDSYKKGAEADKPTKPSSDKGAKDSKSSSSSKDSSSSPSKKSDG